MRPEVTSIVMHAIASLSEDPTIVTEAGIDKDEWLRRLSEYLQCDEPLAYAELANAAVKMWLRSQIGWFIRNSKEPAVESLTEWASVCEALKQANRIVQIRTETGDFLAKREGDCSPSEFDRLAAQYFASGAADMRRGRFYQRLAQQMRLAGLDDKTPLRTLWAA